MPGACQLSGNVVPAVGKGEGATPRRKKAEEISHFLRITTHNIISISQERSTHWIFSAFMNFASFVTSFMRS